MVKLQYKLYETYLHWQTLYVNVYLRLFMPSNTLVNRKNRIKSLHIEKVKQEHSSSLHVFQYLLSTRLPTSSGH